MTSPASKRAHLALETPDTTDTEPESDEENEEDEQNSTDEMLDEDEEEDDEEEAGNPMPESLQVDFEARSPMERDFHGIKLMLRKLFRHGNFTVNINALTQYIISQRKVGSIITQAPPLDDDDEDNPEDDDMYNEVYGVATVVRIDDPILGKEIKGYLQRIVKKIGPVNPLSELFTNPANVVGMIVSERIISIPPQISYPLYQTLFGEIRRAAAKNLPFKFSHYVMITRMDDDPAPSPQQPDSQQPPAPRFDKAEEEIFVEECDDQFEVEKLPASAEGADLNFGKSIKILVFGPDKIASILNKLKVV